MAAAISESHPLRRLFSGLVKQTFFITLPSSTSTQRFFARRFLRQGKAQNDRNGSAAFITRGRLSSKIVTLSAAEGSLCGLVAVK